jgi:general secretion pathway protein H
MSNRMQQHSSSEAGFTLLEMIAAIALIALAASIVVPRLGANRQAMKVRATAIELASNLKITRSAALSRNADAVLVIDTAKRKYSASGAVKPKLIPRDVALTFEAQAAESPRTSEGGFRFRPDGSSSGGRIKLKSGTDAAMITVDWLTGAVTLKTR